MKHYIGDIEAQQTGYERAVEDKEKVKKIACHEIRRMWGLRFKTFTTIIFFNTKERMEEKKDHYEMLYGAAKIIKPKTK